MNNMFYSLFHQPTMRDVHGLSEFGKEITSEAKRVPKIPCIGCKWACIGSRKRDWSCIFEYDLFAKTGKQTGYHMWERE